jgi:uncharacterized protein YbaR (Trm112 family)
MFKDERVGDKVVGKNPECPECKQYFLKAVDVEQGFGFKKYWWCKNCNAMFEVKG